MQACADTLDAMPRIPAMTTEAERLCYYRLALEYAADGAVVELGPWLGASTAYIAAGMRDAGLPHKVQVYDYFRSKPGHAAKVKAWYANHGGGGEIPFGDCLEQFKANLGPLMEYVEPHKGDINKIKWHGDRIAILIADAPKRVPAISAVLTALRHGLQPGSFMAWQDFAHFPSYEIPACLYRLRNHIDFVEAVVPGTTFVFRVRKPWDKPQVSPAALSLDLWKATDIERAWQYWLEVMPREKAALFQCGRAMFLCDTGHKVEAVSVLQRVVADDADAILPKWRYLQRQRLDFVGRYQPLFDSLVGLL